MRRTGLMQTQTPEPTFELKFMPMTKDNVEAKTNKSGRLAPNKN